MARTQKPYYISTLAPEEAVEEFFSRLDGIASAKDVAENGPNPPLTRRTLHATALTMNEILLAMRDLLNERKNPHAVKLGQRGGRKGGRARADKLTPERRSEIARRAAEARWGKR